MCAIRVLSRGREWFGLGTTWADCQYLASPAAELKWRSDLVDWFMGGCKSVCSTTKGSKTAKCGAAGCLRSAGNYLRKTVELPEGCTAG